MSSMCSTTWRDTPQNSTKSIPGRKMRCIERCSYVMPYNELWWSLWSSNISKFCNFFWIAANTGMKRYANPCLMLRISTSGPQTSKTPMMRRRNVHVQTRHVHSRHPKRSPRRARQRRTRNARNATKKCKKCKKLRKGISRGQVYVYERKTYKKAWNSNMYAMSLDSNL